MLVLSDNKGISSQSASDQQSQKQGEPEPLSESLRIKNPINMNYRISKYDPLESIQEVIHKQLFQARVSSENILQRVNLPRAPVREDMRYSNNQFARQELHENFSCNSAENYAYSESRSYLSCNDAESSAWESSAQTESSRSERGSVQSETVASRKSRSTTKAQ